MKDRCQMLPFLNGVFVAVDAVPNAYLIVDGPYCVATKAEMQHCHNLKSELIRPLGRSRVLHTAQSAVMEEVVGLSTDRLRPIERLFERVCGYPDADAVFTTSFDFHELLNFPLKDIARRFSALGRRPVLHIPSASLGGTWLDGYARFCETLAQGIPLPGRGSPGRQPLGRRRRPRTAAVVGYLFDRDEPDHAGNLSELRRLFSALGWRVASVWLSGRGLEELQEVARASVIVSLPYGRRAARALARRNRVRLVELDLPLGLKRTKRFMESLGRALGQEAASRRFVDQEARAAARAVQAHIQRVISGRRAVIEVDDPHLEEALADLCRELGLAVEEPSSRGDDGADDDRAPVLFGSTLSSDGGSIHVPVGYPDYADHPVLERPYLGFSGFRHLVDRVAAAILAFRGTGA
ncbi:MAG: hypothetical protein HY748_05535 [Elusimicrobia bacterium]|nr:hypothetical protein [Elusimicrobiota bacterium]